MQHLQLIKGFYFITIRTLTKSYIISFLLMYFILTSITVLDGLYRPA